MQLPAVQLVGTGPCGRNGGACQFASARLAFWQKQTPDGDDPGRGRLELGFTACWHCADRQQHGHGDQERGQSEYVPDGGV